MLPLHDPKWKTLTGGYGTAYDASIALQELAQADDPTRISQIMKELWEQLHYQGNVGLASYYALPHLIRIAREKSLPHWDIPALVAVIEIARHADNPQLPEAEVEVYESEIREILEVIKLHQIEVWDQTYFCVAMAAISAAYGQIQLAEVMLEWESRSFRDQIATFMNHWEEMADWMPTQSMQIPPLPMQDSFNKPQMGIS
ncbi:hypothetical protein [Pontibacter sp. G13]|uniref:hypothetical protein n=1 Tax=Pontibacter sp. G13 TaxID=3074898 RepID=UPI00288A8022|nr:hypothetical protein [Pontibacter sp. G13]WNJ17837.1 hypothetical protein RJD25_23540 [Pontibacter sp. G13]